MGILPAGRKARRSSYLLVALILAALALLAAPQVRAWYHLRAARDDLARYHFAQARAHAAVPLQAWPNSWRVHLLAARAARLAGASDEAARHLHRCQELQPDAPDVLLEWALLRASTGDLARVEDYLRGELRQDPARAALVRAALVEGYARVYRVGDALACVEGWLREQPDDTQALYLRGLVWQQVQRPLTALASYRRVVELDPERDDARWRLAQCLLKGGAADEAVAHLEYLHRRFPENREMTVELARGRLKQGQTAEAGQLLDAVLAEQPDYVPALAERGRLALAAGDAAAAEKWLRRALPENGWDAQVGHLLHTALLQQGRQAEAEELDARLRQTDRDFKRLEQICLHELGERPDDPALSCELGTLLLRLGYREAGRAWLLSALSRDPTYAPARAALEKEGLRTGG